jgi:23S rRNA pseudouridine1911/1915/1917 synthase
LGLADVGPETVNAPAAAGLHSTSPIWLKQAIHEDGAPASTEFVVEERFEKKRRRANASSLVRALPRTGRTHQIRVHLASLGHSIVGDKIYGPDEQHYLRFIKTGWTCELQNALLLPRHALHSTRLKVSSAEEWQSSLPRDLADWLSQK